MIFASVSIPSLEVCITAIACSLRPIFILVDCFVSPCMVSLIYFPIFASRSNFLNFLVDIGSYRGLGHVRTAYCSEGRSVGSQPLKFFSRYTVMVSRHLAHHLFGIEGRRQRLIGVGCSDGGGIVVWDGSTSTI